MDIKHGRMVHLGYAKYWRSDEIVGLLPIEEERGPGRRTRVYVSTREEPVVASRTEEAILDDLLREQGQADVEELRATVEDLRAALTGLSPVLKRMLRNEGDFDVGAWLSRLSSVTRGDEAADDGQEELFPDA